MAEALIPFNKPYVAGPEYRYIAEAVASGKLSGNGAFTQYCQRWFETNYGFGKVLLTSSCTDALEMCALLANLVPGDEVIIPSYTFVSTANAFVLRGAKVVFADSLTSEPNVDTNLLEPLITDKTKAIVVVHYAGVAVDMDVVMALARRYNLLVIEDAAQAIDSYYKGRPLGSIGHLAAFSFHETKNIIAGEGGMLVVNDDRFKERAEILWEKGTNRAAFFRGEVNKYGWVDVGSSFLPSEVTAAFLRAQIEHLEAIQARRKELWQRYWDALAPGEAAGWFTRPCVPDYATNNAHMFYLVCRGLQERQALIRHLKDNGILAVFHYLSLHTSEFYAPKHDGRELPNSDRFSDCLVRLPLYYELSEAQIMTVCGAILSTFVG